MDEKKCIVCDKTCKGGICRRCETKLEMLVRVLKEHNLKLEVTKVVTKVD